MFRKGLSLFLSLLFLSFSLDIKAEVDYKFIKDWSKFEIFESIKSKAEKIEKLKLEADKNKDAYAATILAYYYLNEEPQSVINAKINGYFSKGRSASIAEAYLGSAQYLYKNKHTLQVFRAPEYLGHYANAVDDGNVYFELGQLYLGRKNKFNMDINLKGMEEESLAWYRKSYEKGNLEGLYEVAMIYVNENFGKDYNDAVVLFEELASKGHLNSQMSLGRLYDSHLGLENDSAKSIKYYQMAKANGAENVDSQITKLNKRINCVERNEQSQNTAKILGVFLECATDTHILTAFKQKGGFKLNSKVKDEQVFTTEAKPFSRRVKLFSNKDSDIYELSFFVNPKEISLFKEAYGEEFNTEKMTSYYNRLSWELGDFTLEVEEQCKARKCSVKYINTHLKAKVIETYTKEKEREIEKANSKKLSYFQ